MLLVEVGLGSLDHVALHRGTAVLRLEEIEGITDAYVLDAAILLLHRLRFFLDAPCQREVGGEGSLGSAIGVHDSGGVFLATGVANDATAARILEILANDFGNGGHFVQTVGLPELKVSATREKLLHTLGLLDTRHFYHNLTHLTTSLEDLDVGLSHTEAVDTRTDHLVGIGHGRFHLLDEGSLDVSIAGRGRDAFKVGGKGTGEVFAIGLDELIEEVAAVLFYVFTGRLNSLVHFGLYVLVCACGVLEHVSDRHFEDDVHTTLEVEAEADLQLFALLQRLPHIDFLVTH